MQVLLGRYVGDVHDELVANSVSWQRGREWGVRSAGSRHWWSRTAGSRKDKVDVPAQDLFSCLRSFGEERKYQIGPAAEDINVHRQ